MVKKVEVYLIKCSKCDVQKNLGQKQDLNEALLDASFLGWDTSAPHFCPNCKNINNE